MKRKTDRGPIITRAVKQLLAVRQPPPGSDTTPARILSGNKFNHDPIARFRVIRKALGPEGINFTFSESLDALTPRNLAGQSDAKMARRLVAAAGAPIVREETVPLTTAARRGKKLYFSCVACHQPDGRGLPGAFPSLVNSPRVLGNEETLIKITLKGLEGPITTQGKQFDGMMPGHEHTLDDRQVADVLSYICGNWGHRAGDVASDTVKKVRDAVKERKLPRTEPELD